MNEYFTKQIQNCCHLSFKTKIFKINQQQPPYRKNRIQQSDQKIKQEKISLKKVSSSHVSNSRKQLNTNSVVRLRCLPQQSTHTKTNQENRRQILQSTKKLSNNLSAKEQQRQLNLCRSLPKDLNRRYKQKRNLVQQLKQYKRQKQIEKNISSQKFQIEKNSKTIGRVVNMPLKNFVMTTPQPLRHLPEIQYNTPNSKQFYVYNSQPLSRQNSPFSYFENKFNDNLQQIPIRKIQSQNFISLPYQASQFHQSIVTREDEVMKQVYNDYDMDYQIKLDLISSIKNSKQQLSNNKIEQSLRSTMISPSQVKPYKYQPSVFSTPTHGFNRVNNNFFDHNNKISRKITQFDEKRVIDKRERFKSIVSVHSQHDSSEQKMKDSVVLQTHNNLRVSGRVTKLI